MSAQHIYPTRSTAMYIDVRADFAEPAFLRDLVEFERWVEAAEMKRSRTTFTTKKVAFSSTRVAEVVVEL